MKLYRFELLFFDGTVLTGKFCVGVPLEIQYNYLTMIVASYTDERLNLSLAEETSNIDTL